MKITNQLLILILALLLEANDSVAGIGAGPYRIVDLKSPSGQQPGDYSLVFDVNENGDAAGVATIKGVECGALWPKQTRGVELLERGRATGINDFGVVSVRTWGGHSVYNARTGTTRLIPNNVQGGILWP